MKITFGKHKGTDIKDLPEDYIIWLLKQSIKRKLETELNRELARRSQSPAKISTTSKTKQAPDDLIDIRLDIKRVHKQLIDKAIKQYGHTSNEVAMLNDYRDKLLEKFPKPRIVNRAGIYICLQKPL